MNGIISCCLKNSTKIFIKSTDIYYIPLNTKKIINYHQKSIYFKSTIYKVVNLLMIIRVWVFLPHSQNVPSNHKEIL